MAEKKKKQFQTPPGMHDILPEEQPLWNYLKRVSEEILSYYNFEKIDTPTLEYTELFEQGTGRGTDIVQKEMFTLKTKGGDSLTLRPEGTASIARAYIQHGMKKWSSPVKLYYISPMFRHEKPQHGRFRQFHHIGMEILGENHPVRDAEVIHSIFVILQRFRLDACAEVNSVGCSECRPKYVKQLKDHYRYRLKQVCADCRNKYKNDPLRILDCEEEKCYRVKNEAPHILDYLCEDCKKHFQKVLEFLDFLNLPYLLNPHLVRGLDYYTRTVFEFYEGNVIRASDEANEEDIGPKKRLAFASGGRYDKLVKFLGGEDTPAVGGSIGVERLIEIIQKNEKQSKFAGKSSNEVFFVQLGDMAKKKTLQFLEEFRKAGIPVRESLGRDSISGQLKLANKFEAKVTVILGQKEVMDGVAIIREMDTGAQETVPEDKLIQEVKKRIKNKR